MRLVSVGLTGLSIMADNGGNTTATAWCNNSRPAKGTNVRVWVRRILLKIHYKALEEHEERLFIWPVQLLEAMPYFDHRKAAGIVSCFR